MSLDHPSSTSGNIENGSDRKLAAILFADIEGYTSLMQKGEEKAMSIVNRFQEVCINAAGKYHGEIIKTYGDGSIMLFSSTVHATQCAYDMQIAFREIPIVPLRIGIHVGEIVRKGNDVFGNGVNIASRIESMGIPGAILLSHDAQKKIKNQESFKTQSLGSYEFKNVEEPIEVFAISNEGFPIPEKDQMQGKLKTETGKKSSGIGKWSLAAILVALLGSVYFITKSSFNSDTASKAIAAIPPNSIAVLPFDNMSADAENEYFTDGIHDDLLTHLSKISDMKVISRTSVKRFKDTDKSTTEIAKELGVANILEGSVRRAGDQIRINVQLIKADSDEHLWSEIYDRALTTTNIFEIQTEIAKEIAKQLRTNIGPGQLSTLNSNPTENLEAYELYLRARQLIELRNDEAFVEAIDLLEKSTALDPSFAEAYVQLGMAHHLRADYSFVQTSVADSIAAIYLDTAMSLNDHMAEAYTLKGAIIPEDQKDQAEEAFQKAIELNPNYERAYHWYALNTDDLEKRDSLISLALSINPLSPVLLLNKANNQRRRGHYDEAKRTYQKIISIEPNYEQAYERLASIFRHEYGMIDSAAIYNHMGVKALGTFVIKRDYIGTLAELGLYEEALSELATYDLSNPQHAISAKFSEVEIDEMRGDWVALEPKIRQFAQLLISIGNTQVTEELLLAEYGYVRRDFKTYLDYIEKYEPELLDTTKEKKIDFGIMDPLNVIRTLQALGRQDKANQLTEHYAYLPDTVATLPYMYDDRAEFHRILYTTLTGDHDRALDLLEESVARKHYLPFIQKNMDPIFDALRENPRYIAIDNQIEKIRRAQAQNFRNYLRGPD